MGIKKPGKKLPRIRSVKQIKRETKIFTCKQLRFAEAFMKTQNAKEAALIAGYSKKYAAQAGYQALEALREKAPEVIGRMGITLQRVIEKQLLPKLRAKQTIFAQKDGQFSDWVQVDNHGIQLQATRELLTLMKAYPPEDPRLQGDGFVNTIIVDVVRPDYTKPNTIPSILPEPRVRPVIDVKPSDNGHKEDPRPKD
jgi:phage terminase small subunit